ncbi:O-antigen ABC transporter, ATP-binding protein RfbB [Thermobacillus xylanilyticus]|jgi:ABC-type polysaccharide/polyol phosphate transport system ATPase subunit|uniref:O-antigen ABC transporter, ATP-binding protein RfbB n=1 Tax=Thermobacillus xylanilyticus TaxID=76633 RepID=A0ABM8V5F5_THEXY|nr:ABC transporter ATP-binding protein [Thermobacillus xylanilyticus]CAG5088730.1 O-antigen ABC transporter, ATP-binding protein RfbB [Thermobacillus xylanilyticus]
MDSDIAIEVCNVSMTFNLSKERVDSLKEYVLKMIKGELLYQEFTALSNVSFQVRKKEVLALVGLNGAGKSTLLKIIAGVLKPTKGHVKINGTVAPLIELGAGFNPNLTGRENIFLNGAVLGYSNQFMKEKFEEIVDFSGLHEFIDVPLKNYSSGMLARLGFSIATVVEPEILLVDEALSVGDYRFMQKCEARIQSMIKNGATVLFVSHSTSDIRKICNRALLLERGKVVMIDDVETVLKEYQKR